MASPTVVGTAAETAISTANTSHVVNLPTGTAGNMFVAIMSKGSAGTTPSVNTLTGWNELLDEAIVLGLYIAVKECDGTEGATTTFTLSSATRGAWIVYEVTGQVAFATQSPQVGTTATGSSTTPDPPSVSVTGGSNDILTIACFGRSGEEADDDTWVTSAPSGFGGLLQKACGVAGTNLAGMVATAHLGETTATADPGTFTAVTGAWRAQTVVVHPFVATTFERSASLDAAASISSSAEFFSVFERSAVLDAVAEITSSGQFFSILERSASFDAVAEIASSGTFSITIERSASLSATAEISASGETGAGPAAPPPITDVLVPPATFWSSA